ncbi:uncharacterized protein CTRU02_205193 [Colletotrichum truncatum]|uniref:Uncharacterized protein n=1 Tax=Colletotrichum truncatum TaxID=5467 RepID=A0ACC3Z3B6_COLTU|nr:uncharacterized protein CTRU02_05985 [Colletotrichum truncatum]KAF6793113.1 hypothetical protein CTRU02_05985 [Colletotrichum truncatum]
MSKNSWAQSDEKASDRLPGDAPQGQVYDDSYTTTKSEAVPVTKDDADIEDPVDPATADSDKQLDRDEREAIDKSNVVKEKTRHAKPANGTYQEPNDDDLGLTQ